MGNWIIRVFILFQLVSNGVCSQGMLKEQSDEIKPAPRYFGPHRSLNINIQKRKLWIQAASEKVSDLENTKILDVISPVLIDIPDFKQLSYRIHKKGKIRFSNGDIIAVHLHSAHEDPEIGDVVVAFANDGAQYLNEGHVCGGMIHMIRQSAIIPSNKEEFFEQFFSDTDDEKWLKSDISTLLKKK